VGIAATAAGNFHSSNVSGQMQERFRARNVNSAAFLEDRAQSSRR
jgi:hypothetical protein